MKTWLIAYGPYLIPILVPLVLAKTKQWVGANTWLIPIIASALGSAADALLALAAGSAANPSRAALLGLAGVGLREMVDQLRKTPAGTALMGAPKVAVLLALSGLAAGGCAGLTLPADPTRMSADQLAAWAKDRNANVSCIKVGTPYGQGNAVAVVLDRDVVVDGSLTVDDQCKVTITSAPAVPRSGKP